MDFGKLPDISHVDFTLPDDHPLSVLVTQPAAPAGPLSAYVGATGWGFPEWKGKWYPSKARPDSFLQHYSQQFGTIEFNTTHYRIPDPEQVDKWYHAAAPGFKFCPKVPQSISHRNGFGRVADMDAFCASMELLREKLGPIFIQLPEYFGPDRHRDVSDFLKRWPTHLPLHWEFRHPAWFQGDASAEQIFQSLQNLGHGLVITDTAGRRDVVHMRLTNPVLVLRFVGNGLHASDFKRLQDWANRLESWKKLGLKEAYIFIHQPEPDHVPRFAIDFAQAIHQATHSDLRFPHDLEGKLSLF